MADQDTDFGYRFRKALRESQYRDFTQAELAKIFDVAQNTISTWQSGIRYPTLQTGQLICRKLNICPD